MGKYLTKTGLTKYTTKLKEYISKAKVASAASADNATKVNNHTVNSDVPANAKFTDTIYTEATNVNAGLLGKAVKDLILILSPFTPHICEEMWEHIGQKESLVNMAWPEYDEAALVKDEVEIVIQINGKLKDKIFAANNSDRAELEKAALERKNIQTLLEGKTVVKVIVVPNKLVNIVLK